MGQETLSVITHLLYFDRRDTQNPGMLNGGDPTQFDATDPLRLWIIQAGIIIATTTFLGSALRRFGQPKVFAEILGGILLGPSGFGRIPGFTDHIFPPISLPYLSLVANVGLCLFLFLVGLEIDGGQLRRNAKLSIIVSFFGTAIPFAVGCATAFPLYNTFIKIGAPQADSTLPGPTGDGVPFSYFMLFSGVAFSVTGFPVVCRILDELNLMHTTVGVVSLAAGVGTGVVGWILLAASVALVNAVSGLTALWTLLLCIAWMIVMLIPVRKAVYALAKRTKSIDNGPSVLFMTILMMIMFGSAFFIDIIGVNAIFGALVAGLVVPRENELAIKLRDKMKDVVSIVFVPLYFALSGLSTDLGLLDNGITWAFTIAIILSAFISKFVGSTLASLWLSNVNLRQASTIGALMSCKGLVELIVLNVGLSAGILNKRVFSMFVLEALTLTFTTTPMIELLYPPRYRDGSISSDKSQESTIVGHSDVESQLEEKVVAHPLPVLAPTEDQMDWKAHDVGRVRQRFAVVLDNFSHLPALLTTTQLLQPPRSDTLTPAHDIDAAIPSTPRDNAARLSILRLIEPTEVGSTRTSPSPITSSQTDTTINDIVQTVPRVDMTRVIAQHAESANAEVVVLPWLLDASPVDSRSSSSTPVLNPFGTLFGSSSPAESTAGRAQFVYDVFNQVGRTKDVLVFVDTSKSASQSTSTSSRTHLFLPFFGGADDRLALDMVVQMCMKDSVTATVVRISKGEAVDTDPDCVQEVRRTSCHTIFSNDSETVLGDHEGLTRLQSGVLDDLLWSQCIRSGLTKENAKAEREVRLVESLERITFKEVRGSSLLKVALDEAEGVVEACQDKTVIVVAGRSRNFKADGFVTDIRVDIRKALGKVAPAFVAANAGDGVFVIQAGSDAGR